MRSPALGAGWPGGGGSQAVTASHCQARRRHRSLLHMLDHALAHTHVLALDARSVLQPFLCQGGSPRSRTKSPRVFAEVPLFKAVPSHGRRRSTQAWPQPRGPFPKEGWPQPLPRDHQVPQSQHDGEGERDAKAQTAQVRESQGAERQGAGASPGLEEGRAGGEGEGGGLPEPLTAHERPTRPVTPLPAGCLGGRCFCTSVLPPERST